jgi:signal transduction histidine kinase
MIGDNLVSNTIIYVGEGQIKLSIKQGNSNLPVKILDKGVGMLKDYFVKVFEASE